MARHYVTCLILVLMNFSSLAQEYEDKIMINISIGSNLSSRLDNDDDIEINHKLDGFWYYNMKGGYFINVKNIFGFSSGYMYDKDTEQAPLDDTLITTKRYNTFDTGPFYKGYFKLLKNFNFTLTVSPFYRYSAIKKSYPGEEFNPYVCLKENSIYLSVLPGLSLDLNKNFCIEFELGFYKGYLKFQKIWDSPVSSQVHQQVVYGTATSLNEFDINDFNFGLTYRFNVK
ncbi:MAG: hypothetical protein FJY07_14865 [Bacteroidetes bacterium]|nr:hypothetical protein [Bacteroidota bacterium]